MHIDDKGEAVDSQGNDVTNSIDEIFDKEEVKTQLDAGVLITKAANPIIGEKLFNAIGDIGKLYDDDGDTIGYKPGYEPGSQLKTTLHIIGGGLLAALGGGDALAGAVGAGLPHALTDEIGKLPEAQQRVVAAIILGSLAGAALGDGISGGYAGFNSRQFNDEKTLAEQQATIKKLEAQCQQIGCNKTTLPNDISLGQTVSAYQQVLIESIESLGEAAAAIQISIEKNGVVATGANIGQAIKDEALDVGDLPRETGNQLEIIALQVDVARAEGDLDKVAKLDAERAAIVTAVFAGVKGLAVVVRKGVEFGEVPEGNTKPNLGTKAGATDGELIAQPPSNPSTGIPSKFDPRHSDIDYDNISTAKAHQATKPRDLNEQAVWNQVVENPASGRDTKLAGDPRFPRGSGWTKREAVHQLPDKSTVTIHYQYNTHTGKAYDMKFTTPKRVPPELQPGPSLGE